MNKTYTLKELADMFAFERKKALVNDQSFEEARMLALKRVLDTIGYEFPVDPEREAFDAWLKEQGGTDFMDMKESMFLSWKAGREELRKEVCSDKCEDSKTEPAWIPWHGDECPMKWIPWHGGSKSPITGARTRYEIEYRDGAKTICTHNTLRWSHNGTAGDIIAYRIIY